MKDEVDVTLVVDVSETIEGVMAAIERNGYRSVVVVDDKRQVLGTASDGDLRKALLAHRLLSTPVSQVMRRNCLKLSVAEVHGARSLFERERVFLIPVIDAQGRLVRVLTAY